jgi:hypothetical protein
VYTAQRVDAHNAKRSLHVDTNPVTANLDIACQALFWADILAEEERWEHAPSEIRPNQGENLAMSASFGMADNELIPEEGWYDEEEPNYNYATGSTNGGVIGHFT